MKRIIPFFFCLFLAACASNPVQNEGGPAMKGLKAATAIDARAQVQNKVEKKTVTVQIMAVAAEPQALSMQITAGFGALLGKVTMSGRHIVILLPQQKKAYLGEISDNSLQPILHLSLNPRDLWFFLMGAVPKSWTCELKSFELDVCVDPTKRITLEHDPRLDHRQAKWTVSSDRFAMTVLPSSIKTNVQPQPELFSFNIPEGYSKHKLP